MKRSDHSGSEQDEQGKPMIFVVDDEPMLLDLVMLMLAPAGYEVRTFRDAELALQAYETAARPPAIVITDFAMHSMTGMEFIHGCRRLNPRQKIIMVSGTVDETIYRDSLVKPDRFLAKPFEAGQLIDLVDSLLHQAL